MYEVIERLHLCFKSLSSNKYRIGITTSFVPYGNDVKHEGSRENTH